MINAPIVIVTIQDALVLLLMKINGMAIYQLMVDIYKFPKILHLGLLMALA